MPLRLYADECVNGRIVTGLRRRGINVVTAADENLLGATDAVQFAHAVSLGLVVLSADNDFLRLANQHITDGNAFPGLIFIKPQSSVGDAVTAVNVVAEVLDPADMVNSTEWVP